MSVITENLVAVKNHIKELSLKAGRADDAVKLIAVSKTRTLQEVQQAIGFGQCDFGENTIQDALTKIPELTEHDIDWHFIGHLQSKKAKNIPGNFQWLHSIDSLKLAQKLSAAITSHCETPEINCLIQVNVAEEISKSGLTQTEVIPFLDELLQQELPGLNWRGLMTIGVQGNEAQTGKAFSALRNLLNKCQQASGLKDFDQLSMGMSNDYAIAIQEGSTMVRVGTAIFGVRKPK
jgi:pyridoxal phosphate enzyme (YggS family)